MLNRRFLNKSSALMMLLLGMLSLAALIKQTFALSLNDAFPYFLSALCVFFWFGTFGRKRFILALILASLTVFAAFYLYSVEFKEELRDLIWQIRGVYYNYFTGDASAPTESALPHTALMLAFFFPLAFYFSQALTAARSRIFLVLAFYLPLTLACLTVTGTPSPLTIFFMLVFIVLLLIGGSFYSDDSGRGGLLWTTVIPAAMLVQLCIFLADPAHYSFDDEDVARSRRFDRFSRMITRMVEGESDKPAETTPKPTVAGDQPLSIRSGHWSVLNERLNLNEGNLHTDNDRVALRVTAETRQCLYLRRCSYGDYTGTSWLLAKDDAPLSSLPFAAQAASETTESRQVLISLVDRGDLTLIPYFSTLAGESDSFVRWDGEDVYTVVCYAAGKEIYTLRLSGEAGEGELAYRSYAHGSFTSLPDSTKASAGRILEEAGIYPDDEDLIWEIADFVRRSGRYDLRTAAYPTDDYAIYFLTQAHRGYCLHFATAAVVLYRAAGIPARLTDGYMISTRAGESVDVRIGDQHAWAEIYIDGLGWVPVEVTPGSGFFENEKQDKLPSPFAPEDNAWIEPVYTPAPASEPGFDPADATETPLWKQTEEPETTPGLSETTDGGTVSSAGTQEKKKSIDLSRLLKPILPFVLIIGIRELQLLWRRQRIRQKDRRKAAIAVWREAKRLYRRDVDIPDDIRSCAERAAFGRDAPDQEQLKKAQDCLMHLERVSRENPSLRTRLHLLLFGRIFR